MLSAESKRALVLQFVRHQPLPRMTSQEICDQMKDVATVSVDEVTEILDASGYKLEPGQSHVAWQLRSPAVENAVDAVAEEITEE